MIDVRAILDLHEKTVSQWHEREVDNSYDGFLSWFAFSTSRTFAFGIKRTSPAAPK